MKEKKSIEAGDEVTVDGKVYVVTLNASMVLTGTGPHEGCAALINPSLSIRMCGSLQHGGVLCQLPEHLIYKLKGGSDVQDKVDNSGQVAAVEEGKSTDVG